MPLPVSQHRGMSPAARAMRHRKVLGWGVALLVLWAVCSLGFTAATYWANEGRANWGISFATSQVIGGSFFVTAAVLVIIGVAAEVKAKAFETRDRTLATSLARHLDTMLATVPRTQAYEHDPSMSTVNGAKIVEVERHFDQQTAGAITGALSHRLSMFGTSFSMSSGSASSTATGPGSSVSRMSSSSLGTFSGTISGLSRVELGLSTTTRDNLMGDALFSVFEYDNRGARDTLRVTSMSRPAVQSWIADLVGAVAARVGGQGTHAGSAILLRTPSVIALFEPPDISYATDRLKAMVSRPYDEREPITVSGTAVGRNAMIATTLQIRPGEQLHLFPAQLPMLFGRAVGSAFAPSELRPPRAAQPLHS